jgi:hypothetical protein
MSASAALQRSDWVAGGITAALGHVAIGAAMWLSPSEPPPEATTADPLVEGCASIVTPACVGAVPLAQTAVPKDSAQTVVGDRRCPEPMKRLLRRESEPPPSVDVDLLQAELVAAVGVETGTRVDSGSQPGGGGQKAPEPPKPKLAEAIGEPSKLGDMLASGDGGEQKKKKLGQILGRADGKAGGQGAVNQTGSAYVREVKTAVQRTFVVPAEIAPWEVADLVAKVRITRMTAGGQVLEFSLLKSSGNDNFDKAVRSLMKGYQSGMRSLPAPPPHLLADINSRGLVIELRGGR